LQIKENQSKLSGQVPQFKEKLEAYKKELSREGALVINEEAYVEI